MLVLAHAGAVAAITASGILLSFKVAAAALIAANAYAALRSACTQGELTWFDANHWVLHEHDEARALKLSRRSIVTRYFCVLMLENERGAWQRSIVVTPRGLRPGVYRKLIVRLRVNAAQIV